MPDNLCYIPVAINLFNPTKDLQSPIWVINLLPKTGVNGFLSEITLTSPLNSP